jgi:hypothetical protein
LEELKLEGEIRGLLYSDSKEEKGKEERTGETQRKSAQN